MIRRSGGSIWKYLKVAQALLEHGADANARDKDIQMLLHLASKYGCIHVARLLREHGVGTTTQDNSNASLAGDAP